jgi:hypothetical protein
LVPSVNKKERERERERVPFILQYGSAYCHITLFLNDSSNPFNNKPLIIGHHKLILKAKNKGGGVTTLFSFVLIERTAL